VLQVRVLLRGAQPGAPCGLVLLLALLLLLLGEPSPPVGFLVLLYPLRLGLLLRRGLGLRLGFSRGGLRGLFPLYLGVLSGVPRVQDLLERKEVALVHCCRGPDESS